MGPVSIGGVGGGVLIQTGGGTFIGWTTAIGDGGTVVDIRGGSAGGDF